MEGQVLAAHAQINRENASDMRVLLVEDDSDDAAMLGGLLSRQRTRSVDVTHVTCIADAAAELRASRYDVVLLDLQLPDATGADSVERIQEADSNVPIVVMSGQGDEDYAVEILNRGVQDYLVKWEGDTKILLRSIRYAVERKRSELELNYLARYDSLTGIPNRQYLQDQLERASRRARRSGKKIGLLFLDLDRFKRVNDTFGHHLGDQLLCAVVQRLLEKVRAGDLFARLGGDEFAVLLENVDGPDELETVARHLLDAFKAPFEIDGRKLPVTVSIGVTVFPNDNSDARALLNNADMAMYQAKDKGRNNFEFFTQGMYDEIVAQHTVEMDLKAALAEEQFELLYQPQVSLTDRSVQVLEALLRWNHPERGCLSPDRFISVAEESGYIIPIGDWVLERACRQLGEWRDAGLQLPRIAVNVAPIHFHQPRFSDRVKSTLETYGIDPQLIELELTERSLMKDTDEIRRCLRHLKAIGVRLAIDDFGTGYSCLNYLRQFPIDVLKIDRSFVKDLAVSEDARAICAVILSIAAQLSLGTVAEGIETSAQLEFLAKQGCGFGQGYFFSRPVPPAHLEALLARSVSSMGSNDWVTSSPYATRRQDKEALG
jgi:diguanylate cyclase (GGDEF)-like protein